MTPRGLEPSLSQMLNLVSAHSELMIFICKQLKRPVVFGTVHFDVKPQIIMLQNIFFHFL